MILLYIDQRLGVCDPAIYRLRNRPLSFLLLSSQYTLPWLSAVYSTNVESVSESLLPTPRGCAQVGRLWYVALLNCSM